MVSKKRLLFIPILLLSLVSLAQKPKSYPASELQLALNKLGTLGSVLYVAAHPDDENTRMIAWLSKEKLYNTAYLSLTRGDGGQNLIGPEIRESLGIIRTHELLEARKIDGGSQFFTRANDFGYSKTPEETFNIWDRKDVLADVVWVIRKFRPDVIITRFNTEPGRTHGHHTASAMLAEEAFRMAGDPEAFPEQLNYVKPWRPKKLFWNTSWWFYRDNDNFDPSGLLKVDVGGYSPLLGKSFTEIAAEARSMHRSQGFGAAGARGEAIEYLEPLIGADENDSIFEGIDVSWNRVEGGAEIGALIRQAQRRFNPQNPSEILPVLLEARRKLATLGDSHWVEVKQKELDEVIKGSLGLFLEATTNQRQATHGDSVTIHFETVNRAKAGVQLKSVSVGEVAFDSTLNVELPFNKDVKFSTRAVIPANLPFSQPYWLKNPGSEGMFKVDDQRLIGQPRQPAPLTATFRLDVSGQLIEYSAPVVFKETDPAVGEVYRPLQATPPVFIQADKPVYIFSSDQPQTIEATVKAGRPNLKAELSLSAPEGWKTAPSRIPVNLSFRGEEQVVSFTLSPPEEAQSGRLRLLASVDGATFSKSIVNIEYDHIPPQVWFPEAVSKVVKIDLEKEGRLIGYVPGAGDAIPESLRLIGYDVRSLSDEDFNNDDLQEYDAIILGIRAFNVNERLKYYRDKLFEYAERGGVVIVQYNTSGGLAVEDIAPYPLQLSRDRVAVEDAPVEILEPEHPAMSHPNKISGEDFEGWVQERGLYFPDEWAGEFTPILSSHDPGEEPKKGGLLIARHGKGYYVYTGYSWFRQLPAGAPGAFRIFANLIALGSKSN